MVDMTGPLDGFEWFQPNGEFVVEHIDASESCVLVGVSILESGVLAIVGDEESDRKSKE